MEYLTSALKYGLISCLPSWVDKTLSTTQDRFQSHQEATMSSSATKSLWLSAVFCGTVAWACSGDPSDSGTGGNGGTGSDPACPLSSNGCEDSGNPFGGTSGSSGGEAGTSAQGGSGGSASGGNAGTSGSSGSGSGGKAGASGSSGSSGTGAGTGGESGIAGEAGSTAGGSGGNPDAGEAGEDAGGVGGTGNDDAGDGTGGFGSVASGGAGNGGSAGNSGTGGVSGTSGSSGTGGTGGNPPEPFSCAGAWNRLELPTVPLPDGGTAPIDFTGDIWGTSSSDIYVATTTISVDPDRGDIVHYDGSDWSLSTLPAEYISMGSIWGSSKNDVWAGGTKFENFFYKGALLHRVNQGAWTEYKLFGVTEPGITSIWGSDADNVFALVGYTPNASTRDARIYRVIGGTWTQMTLPSHPASIQMNRIWGKSSTEVYAVGTVLDTFPSTEPIEGLLWKYNGTSWSKITTIPSDVVSLLDVHGTTDVEVVGFYGVGLPIEYHGVRLAAMDLSTWNRYNSTVTEADSRIWSPSLGASLVGGSAPTPPIDGSARLSTLSLGSWSEANVDSIAGPINGILPVPGSSTVMLSTHSVTGAAAVYSGTCQ